MAVYSRALLSASTNGRPIAIGTSSTAIHTPGTSTTAFDEVYLWAQNVTGAAATLTLQFGGTATSDQACNALSIPANSPPIPILTGQCLSGAAPCYAISGTLNAINVEGYINRIS